MRRPTSMIFWAASAATFLGISTASAHSGGHNQMEQAREAERVHHFEQAEHHLREILEDRPQDAQAWLTLASLETVRGDMDDARIACGEAARHFDLLVAMACRGRIALAGGEDRLEALRGLMLGLEHSTMVHREDPLAQWAWGVAAELAVAEGLTALGDRLFERALIAHPAIHLQAAYLDHLLATDRADRVVAETSAEEQELAIKLRRVLALVELEGEDAPSAPIEELHHQFQRWMAEGDFTHGREMAMFYLDVMPRPALARVAATRNLKFQREVEDQRLFARARGERLPQPLSD